MPLLHPVARRTAPSGGLLKQFIRRFGSEAQSRPCYGVGSVFSLLAPDESAGFLGCISDAH